MDPMNQWNPSKPTEAQIRAGQQPPTRRRGARDRKDPKTLGQQAESVFRFGIGTIRLIIGVVILMALIGVFIH